MALALGRPVAHVSIRPGREFLGTCEFGKAVFRPSEDWLEREALIALAGAAAEARRTGEYAWDAAARDQKYVEELALQRAGGARQAQRLLRRLLAKAEHLLAREENWRAVERVAAELAAPGRNQRPGGPTSLRREPAQRPLKRQPGAGSITQPSGPSDLPSESRTSWKV